MGHITSTVQTTPEQRSRGARAADEQHALMRGLVHGIILSLIIWTGVLYLTLAFR